MPPRKDGLAPDKGHQENQPTLSNFDTGLGKKSWPRSAFLRKIPKVLPKPHPPSWLAQLLASVVVPRQQPLQAVATCSPSSMRRPTRPSGTWRLSLPLNFSLPQMHRPGNPYSTLESACPSTPTSSKFSTSIFDFDPATSAALAGDFRHYLWHSH